MPNEPETTFSPDQAVDRLQALHAKAVQAQRDTLARFAAGGAPPVSEERRCFRYPELRLVWEPSGPTPVTRRAWGKFQTPGIYATTVTEPDFFRPYLLDLLRQLALALGYAHGKHLYHQSLAPQNILVRDPDTRTPRLLIMNWQVAMRGEGSSGITPRMPGTHHLADHLSDPAKLYIAPEILSSGAEAGARADVFSLGGIAYRLFTGHPPADNPLDLPAKARRGWRPRALGRDRWRLSRLGGLGADEHHAGRRPAPQDSDRVSGILGAGRGG